MSDKKSVLPVLTQLFLEETKRLDAVSTANQLKATTNELFDQLSAVASSAFKAPVAQVTLLESNRQVFKSSLGFDIIEADINTSFCAYAILDNSAPTIVLNTIEDPRFWQNPFVIDPPYIRFYAGYPIVFEEQNVGTICVYDFEPRKTVSIEQNKCLTELSLKATEIIEKNVEVTTNS